MTDVEAWVKQYGRPKVDLVTDKPDPRDKYGRYVAQVTSRLLPERNLGADLIASGHAVSWNGRGARP
jgi:endonuclease YncB( thermonuclease family)